VRTIAIGMLLSGAVLAQEFDAPVRLKVGDEFIDVDIGHAAPYLYDWDQDGTRHLLVGQFGQGKLRIYINAGTETRPRYDRLEWFRAGGAVATVPAG